MTNFQNDDMYQKITKNMVIFFCKNISKQIFKLCVNHMDITLCIKGKHAQFALTIFFVIAVHKNFYSFDLFSNFVQIVVID